MSATAKKTAKQWEIGQIMETMDYNQFSFIEGNRAIDENHVKFIMRKMEENYLVAPIMCNTVMGIMDGQHRFEACKRSGRTIRYYITDDMDPEQIAEMNSVAKRWKPQDYANVYDSVDYKLYKQFRERFPKLAHSSAIVLLSGGDQTVHGDDAFKTGYFKVKNFSKAVKTAEMLMKMGDYTKVYNKRSFVFAMIHVMNHKDYDEKRMMRKIKHKGAGLKEFGRADDFIKAIQDMYNWMEPTENKVSFVKL